MGGAIGRDGVEGGVTTEAGWLCGYGGEARAGEALGWRADGGAEVGPGR